MPALRFLEHCLRGDIVIHSEMSTCGLKKPLNKINYPDVVVDVVEFAENDAQRMLDNATAYSLLQRVPYFCRRWCRATKRT